MDAVFPYLMGKAWKKQYQIVADYPDASVKSHLPFIRALDGFLSRTIEDTLHLSDITDPDLGVILSQKSMAETWSYHPNDSLYQMERHLNERILSRLKFLCTEKTADFRKAKRQAFRKHFDSSARKWTIPGLYLRFCRIWRRDIRSWIFPLPEKGSLRTVWMCTMPPHLADSAQDLSEAGSGSIQSDLY